MGNWLFGSTGKKNEPKTPPGFVRAQTSIDGKPIPFGYGRTRVPANLIFMSSTLVYSFQQYASTIIGGGKGGMFGSGGNEQNSNTEYAYGVSVMLAFGERPINNTQPFGLVWYNKATVGYAQSVGPGSPWADTGQWGFVPYYGTTTQGPSIQGLNYRSIAYVSSNPMYLGKSPDLPNFTFDIGWSLGGAISGRDGANPKDIIADFLTNARYGVGFPASLIDANTLYSNYCIANGLVLSPYIADQRAATDYLNEWVTQCTNSEFVFTQGLLKVIPYGDETTTANGATYTAPSPLSYSLTDTDYITPIKVTRQRIEDKDNSIKVEYLDTGSTGQFFNSYNPAVAEAKNDAAINIYGLKARGVTTLHAFTEIGPATLCAQLLLGRQAVVNTYEFTVSSRYILIDPMDILIITDNVMGIQALPVRVKEIKENDDYTLTITAEDYPKGSAAAPAYATQTKGGTGLDYNVAPGNVSTPLFFEPPDALANGLEVWAGISSANLPDWGGAEVWASYDDLNYTKLGVQQGPSRMGVTTGIIGSYSPPPQGNPIDNSEILLVNLTVSQSTIASVSHEDFVAFNSAFYVGGEYIGYENVTPTGTYTFSCTPLVRGGYGSDSEVVHPAGTAVARIDSGLFRIPFTQDRIGSTIYVKFLSFNKYGGARQNLADVGAFPYTLQGLALTSPLPDVRNFVSSFVGNITYLDWDIVEDFRNGVEYEIRKGPTWEGAQSIGVFAHPHVPAIGDANYLIKAVCQPVANLKVYSTNATALNLIGSVIPTNLVASYDDSSGAGNWPGVLTGDVVNDGTFIHTLTSTIYDTGFASPNVTLSLGNLRATAVAANGASTSARTRAALSSGRFFCSLTINVNTTTDSVGVGFCNASQLTSQSLKATNNALSFASGGQVWLNNSAIATLVSYTSSDVIDMAVNLDAKLAWFRKNGGNWNNNVSANPVTDTGGISFASMNAGPYYQALELQTNTAQVTANFGATGYTYAPPSGYDSWAQGLGYYTIPTSHIVNMGRLTSSMVQISWSAAGQGTADFFNPGPPDNNDVFAHSDIFDSAANQFIEVHPEIQLSADGTNFGAWQRYQPGFYNFWKVNIRFRLESLDPSNIGAYLTAATYAVYTATRVDHPMVNFSLPAAGQTITFTPDGGSATPFIAGPNGGNQNPSPGVILPNASLPGNQCLILNGQAGDIATVASLSLSSCFLRVFNAGVGVSRNVTFQVWGF